ncbi:MAG: DUF3450 domain-containing protein [Paludibacteraceae bacterium]|nr:DUF3450 domain-containing protein [Paludibacteraceae bacterium]
MLSFLKKSAIENDSLEWVKESEKATFNFSETQEVNAHLLLTENVLIDKILLLKVDADSDKVANDWIDSEEIKIRENNNFDCTIDYFADITNLKEMEKIGKGEPAFAISNEYIDSLQPQKEELDKKLEALKKRIDEQLSILVKAAANQISGMAYAIEILSAINSQNEAFLLEMNDELSQMRRVVLPKEEQDLRERCAKLGSEKGIFVSEESILKHICKEAKDIAKCKIDIVRHEYAIAFFSWFQLRLQRWMYDIRLLISLLDYIRQTNNRELALMVSEEKEGETKNIGGKDVKVGDFISELPGKDIFSICEMTIDEARQKIESFTKKQINQ